VTAKAGPAAMAAPKSEARPIIACMRFICISLHEILSGWKPLAPHLYNGRRNGRSLTEARAPGIGQRVPFAARAALQLQITEPSSPLSQRGVDLQSLDFSISPHSLAPTQAHLHPLSGVSKHLKAARAGCTKAKASSKVSVRRAVRIPTLLASAIYTRQTSQ
jgi:hypothetical protein